MIELRKWLRKGKKGIGLLTLLAGNIAAIVGKIPAINDWLYKHFGIRLLDFLYSNMLILVSALFLIGYAIVFYWLYQKVVLPNTGPKRILFAIAATIIVSATFALNLVLLPSQPNVADLMRRDIDKWVDHIFISQVESGGIRVHASDPSFPTQVWTTAQCLKAVLTIPKGIEDHIDSIKSAFHYMESARWPHETRLPQQRDFDACSVQDDATKRFEPEEGWGYFEEREQAITEIAGWVSLAHIASIESEIPIWNQTERQQILGYVERDLAQIAERWDSSSGGWKPIRAFVPRGSRGCQPYTRTYATVISLWAFIEARDSQAVSERIKDTYDKRIEAGILWLLKTYRTDLQSWVPNPNRELQAERFLGLTAQTLFVLSRAEEKFSFFVNDDKYRRAKKDFLANADLGTRNVLLNDRLHDADQYFRPTKYHAESSTFLWFPWSYVELMHLSRDEAQTKAERKVAANLSKDMLTSNAEVLDKFIESDFMYVLAENLFCLAHNSNFVHSRN